MYTSYSYLYSLNPNPDIMSSHSLMKIEKEKGTLHHAQVQLFSPTLRNRVKREKRQMLATKQCQPVRWQYKRREVSAFFTTFYFHDVASFACASTAKVLNTLDIDKVAKHYQIDRTLFTSFISCSL